MAFGEGERITVFVFGIKLQKKPQIGPIIVRI